MHLATATRPPDADLAFESSASAQMERLLSDLGRMYRERNVALQALENAHHEALIRLAVAAEMRDDDTGAHIVRLGYLAEALARLMGVAPERAQMLRLAAPMHDIGKIGIPDHVLKKPGLLTSEERSLMQTHPRLGAEILGSSRIPLFSLAAEVAMHHHERWDGTGYPRGLAGDDIPLSGRIVAVVDYFDALTMDRCYRPAFADDRALAMLTDQSGIAFDPAVVAAFLTHAPELIKLREWVNTTRPGFGGLGVKQTSELDRSPGSTDLLLASEEAWA
ncbi:HD-GYP domain-containing protein [Roseateles saccharophilus]|uniref:Putative two-component system response regulator n=1 Tax=Roseateles saccharophilus TaxID=304 RepID=A0A4V2VQW7_ROSSA|nr:HD domain-containing phosphohydrolase [Roseateles saccharophilus]TCU96209.1 putative two-component system response regulator [Roseateles saccharophilus]